MCPRQERKRPRADERRVLVVGGGVIGLSCAVRLAEAGHCVAVWTSDPPARTTSAVAAAIWYPWAANPPERVLPWARATYRELASLAARGDAHVSMLEVVEVLDTWPSTPTWREELPGSRPARADELPPGRVAGVRAVAPLAEMPDYLHGLAARLLAAGGRIERRRVTSLEEALEACRVVVHCAGLGARDLASDPAVGSLRGQILRVANPGLRRAWIDDTDPEQPTYVIPRRHDVVLGGTAEPNRDDPRPDLETACSILERAVALEPRLRGARVLGHAVGLRPWRPAVRLEAERRPNGVVVHCYGHGGSGLTLSWGCADEVLAHVGQAMRGA